jgi:hypothetical protein
VNWILKKELSFGVIYFMDLVHCPFLKLKDRISSHLEAKNKVNAYSAEPDWYS